MKLKLNKIFKLRYHIGFWVFLLFTFIANSLHTQFPDEFDNIYGGFLINHGVLPYKGFFTHHNPGAYFLAAIITAFTGRSFVLFRIVFAVLLFVYTIFSCELLKRRLNLKNLNFFLLYGFFIGIGATFWWGQMLLSETIVGYLLGTGLLLVIGKRISRIPFDKKDLLIISILSFFSLLTSLTYIYFIPIFIIIVLYFYFHDNQINKINEVVEPISYFIFPYLIFGLYLIVTGSLNEFYFQSVHYNVSYYIYNFPLVSGQFSHHPLRYALSIAQHTIDNIIVLLTQVPSFNLSYPLNVSLVLGNVLVLIYLFIKKEFSLIVLIVSMMIYTNVRSEPLNTKETDFHSTVFIMLTFSIFSYFFFQIKKELDNKIPYLEKLIISGAFILTFFYWFFTSLFLTDKFIQKVYGKVMGQDPMIYDRPQAAPIINKLITKNDYFWIGPFDLQELLFVEGKVASKYYWFLPASSRDEKIKSEFLSDLEKNKPKVIVFKKWWSQFGVKPEEFNSIIVNFLDKNYFQIKDLIDEGTNVRVRFGRERDFDFETEFYFDKNRKSEIVKELFEKGIIEKI